MKQKSSIRTGRHVVFSLHAHLVFVPKYRHKMFSKSMLKSLENYFETVCQMCETELIEMNGEKDHVHLLVFYPPNVALSRLVNSLKTVSSRLLKKEYPSLKKHLYKDKLWSPSYFVSSCGGAPLDLIKKYIQSQQNL